MAAIDWTKSTYLGKGYPYDLWLETLGLPLSTPKPQSFQGLIRRIAPLALPLYRRLDAQEI